MQAGAQVRGVRPPHALRSVRGRPAAHQQWQQPSHSAASHAVPHEGRPHRRYHPGVSGAWLRCSADDGQSNAAWVCQRRQPHNQGLAKRRCRRRQGRSSGWRCASCGQRTASAPPGPTCWSSAPRRGSWQVSGLMVRGSVVCLAFSHRDTLAVGQHSGRLWSFCGSCHGKLDLRQRPHGRTQLYAQQQLLSMRHSILLRTLPSSLLTTGSISQRCLLAAGNRTGREPFRT